MNIKKGFCRVETKDRVIFGEITGIHGKHISVENFDPSGTVIKIDIKDIINYEAVKEEEIPAYE